MKALRQLKLIAGIIFVSCMLAQLPARAEWSFDENSITERVKTFLRSAIKEAELKETPPYLTGVPVSSLRSRCSSLEISGRSTWDEGSLGYGRAYYIWFPVEPNGIDAVCWEFIKQAIPPAPFYLVKGLNRSAIVKVDYVPFSDPGPSVFFYFGEDPEK